MRKSSFGIFLLLANVLFADPDLSSGYNLQINSCQAPQFSLGAEFLYWEARQDTMELGTFLESEATLFFDLNRETTAQIIDHNFSYQPGFKVLASVLFDLDAWDLFAEYTWFFSETKSSRNVGDDTVGTDVGVTPTRGSAWMLEAISAEEGSNVAVFNKGRQRWSLFFQSLDLALSRSYFVGQKWTFQTCFGAKFDWITEQNQQTFSSNGMLSQSGGVEAIYQAHQSFTLWGAGLLTGLKTRLLLGKGFDLIGSGLFDLLYTYVPNSETKFEWKEHVKAGAATFRFSEKRPDFLLPHANLELGFAWNREFDAKRLDLFATYSFQIFWGVNLFQNFPSNQAAMSHSSNDNLYLQGLNLSAKLDF